MSIDSLPPWRDRVQNTLTRLSARQIAWLVFLVTLLAYWSLVPWVSEHWRLTGDEPHYLVATHSLLMDGDLDLSNNYEQKDFTLFYVGSDLDPHVVIGPDGGSYPAHTLGLSLALLPAYALGYLAFVGHAGVLYFLAAMGALLAANVYLLSYEVTGWRFSSLLGWVATAFTLPVMHYAFRVYPEIMGALLLVWSLRHIRRGGRTEARVWLLVGMCIGFLPWLASRFILLSAFLGVVSLISISVARVDARRRNLSILALCLPVIVLGGLLLAFNAHFYGSVMPSGGTADATQLRKSFVHTSVEKLAEGLVGWMLDQNMGLLVYAPLYVIALPGLLLLLRDRTRSALLLAVPFGIMYFFLGWQGFWIQWDIPVRYLVVVLPLLGVAVVYGVQRASSKSFIGLGLALFSISVTTAMILARDPGIVYSYRFDGQPGLLKLYGRWLRTDISGFVPSFGTPVAVIYARDEEAIERGEKVTDPQAEGRHAGVATTGPVVGAEAATDQPGYVLDALWPPQGYLPPSEAGTWTSCFRMRAGTAESAGHIIAVVDVSTSAAILNQKEVTREELPQTDYGVSCLEFRYPAHRQVRLRVLFTGEADLWIDWVALTAPAQSSRWILSAFWLGMVGAVTTCFCLRSSKTANGPRDQALLGESGARSTGTDSPFGLLAELLVALTIATILASHLYGVFVPRTFETEGQPRMTGEVVTDEQASGREAVYASSDMEPTALVYGPYEFFQPGEYAVGFRMKSSPVAADSQSAATIDVYGAASSTLASRTIESTDFQESEGYQVFYLVVSNPVYQALQFRVIFLGNTDLWVDRVTVERTFAGQR
jgi:hypothetical protein